MVSAGLAVSIVDAIIVLVVIEAVVLWIWFGRANRHDLRVGAMANLGAGVALMLALRAALAGSNVLWVAFFLSLSGIAHLADVRARWMELAR